MASDALPLHAWRDAVASGHGPAATTRLVLLVLALYMDARTTRAWPSIRTLSARSGLNKSTVRDHLELAVRAGWLTVSVIKASGKGWKRHEYVAALPDGVRPDRTPEGVRADRTASAIVSGSTAMVYGQNADGVRPGRTELPKNSSGTRKTASDWKQIGKELGLTQKPGEALLAFIGRVAQEKQRQGGRRVDRRPD